MSRLVRILPLLLVFALPACGGHHGGGDDAGGTIDSSGTGDGSGTNAIDANGTGSPDAPPGAGPCMASNPQCNNCIDDDGDGLIDGADPECTGAIDNDEATFATGIPGDNIDAKNQDCFFDGNSGAGDDGCNQKTCCILGFTQQQCAAAGLGNNFNPATDCPPLSQQCIDFCAPLAPPGCDCFGCCTICDPTNPTNCENVYTNPVLYPSCATNPSDPACCTATNLGACYTCTPNTTCGTSCNSTDPCNPCPGQPPPPPSCTTTTCPGTEPTCNATTACPDPTHQYCSNGCCIGIVG